ncbi:MAG: hypothetical protein H6563_14735 [Lewinellaceae bacterium]|nr:hypothetical protein [Lewinellaceae bacterium]
MKDLERSKSIPRKHWNLWSRSFAFLPLAYTGDFGPFLKVSILTSILCFLIFIGWRFFKVLIGSDKAIKNGRLKFRLEGPLKKELVFLNKGTPITYRIEKRKVSFFARTIQSGEVMIGNAPMEDGWIIKAIADMNDKQLKAFAHGDDIEMIVVDIEEDMKTKRLNLPPVFEE